MGMYDVLDDWADRLDAAGVPVTTDSRGQYSSPSGYALLMPNGILAQRLAGNRTHWFMEGDVYCVVDGPWGTAAGRAVDALVIGVLAVLDQYVEGVDFPDLITLASVGIDQPAARVHYSNVPVSLAT
jgi:hypothetical protein